MEIKGPRKRTLLLLAFLGNIRNIFRKYAARYKIVAVVVICIYSAAMTVVGIKLEKSGFVGWAKHTPIKFVADAFMKFPIHYVNSLIVNCERIYIDIPYKNLQRLNYTQMLAIKNRTLHSVDNVYVNADIRE